jgi:formaldehyde-activating enzyme involved in methanogenesis
MCINIINIFNGEYMANTKAQFPRKPTTVVLDQRTIERLEQAAERRGIAKGRIVDELVNEMLMPDLVEVIEDNSDPAK